MDPAGCEGWAGTGHGQGSTVVVLLTLALLAQHASASALILLRRRRLARRKQAGWKQYHTALDETRRTRCRGSVKHRRKRQCRMRDRVNWCDDFFGDNPTMLDREGKPDELLFHQTYGVPVDVFGELLDRVGPVVESGRDAVGDPGMPKEMALLLALNKLRTAQATVQYKVTTKWGLSTIDGKFRDVVRAINAEFGPECLPGLWSDRMADARAAEMDYNAASGFPFCVGKLDAMVLGWRSCPKKHQGTHKGIKGTGIVVHGVAFHTLHAANIDCSLGAASNDLQALQADPCSAPW